MGSFIIFDVLNYLLIAWILIRNVFFKYRFGINKKNYFIMKLYLSLVANDNSTLQLVIFPLSRNVRESHQ